MNLGQFRRSTKDLPDDFELVATGGDCAWYELDLEAVLESTDAYVGVIVLEEGSEVTEQFWIPTRLGLD